MRDSSSPASTASSVRERSRWSGAARGAPDATARTPSRDGSSPVIGVALKKRSPVWSSVSSGVLPWPRAKRASSALETPAGRTPRLSAIVPSSSTIIAQGAPESDRARLRMWCRWPAWGSLCGVERARLMRVPGSCRTSKATRWSYRRTWSTGACPRRVRTSLVNNRVREQHPILTFAPPNVEGTQF